MIIRRRGTIHFNLFLASSANRERGEREKEREGERERNEHREATRGMCQERLSGGPERGAEVQRQSTLSMYSSERQISHGNQAAVPSEYQVGVQVQVQFSSSDPRSGLELVLAVARCVRNREESPRATTRRRGMRQGPPLVDPTRHTRRGRALLRL